jgi:hypothetical protein
MVVGDMGANSLESPGAMTRLKHRLHGPKIEVFKNRTRKGEK